MKAVGRQGDRATPVKGVTPAQMREAERGLKLMLARKFSAAWIAENAADVLAQACIEYTEWLENNQPARNPVGWLLTCAYRRALNLLDAQNRRPSQASLEAVFQVADDSTPTPEQAALDNDRQQRVRDALGHLPRKERLLLALVYFEGDSIREAGRKLGWQKSAADRHHTAAMEKMLALVGDRSLLTPAGLGLAAQAAVTGEGQRALNTTSNALLGPLREGIAAGSEALTSGAHRLSELWRRIAPFSDPAQAATASGAGRAAGYCAAAAGAVVCGLAATGVVGPGVGALDAEREARPRLRVATPVRPASEPAAPAPATTPTSTPPERAERVQRAERAPRSSPPPAQRQRAAPQPHQVAPQATGSDTAGEFGIESGGEPSSPTPGSSDGESSAPAPTPQPSPAPKPPGSAAANEFGL